MEEEDRYRIVGNNSIPPVITGPYSKAVLEFYSAKYGNEATTSIQRTVTRVYSELTQQASDEALSNNTLLVGKVQSGKTSNLQFLSALAFDNGYDAIVIYGGVDKTLLKQTTKRFKEIFSIDDSPQLRGRTYPILFTSDEADSFSISNLNASLINKIVNLGVPLILSVLKHHGRISAATSLLEEIEKQDLKVLVIDDEGDQASLNNVKDKSSDASATYASIQEMKRVLRDPVYCSVTATPQANIFLDELSDLRPSSVHLLYPGEGYCGADVFHLQDNLFTYTDLEEGIDDLLSVNEGNMPDSLRKAVRHFLLASVLMVSRDITESDMIVHADRTKNMHTIIFNWISDYVSYLQDSVGQAVQNKDYDTVALLFEETYLSLFPEEIRGGLEVRNETFCNRLKGVLNETFCVLQNGEGDDTKNAAQFYDHCIYIGADLLQRGITFDYLVTTYFTRWAKTGGNMDTNLQRARWFGYRERFLDLSKMFTTEDIEEEFISLAYMENDLWSQFEAIQGGELAISDVVILAKHTRQNPTRKSVVGYSRFTISDWMRQNVGTFDVHQLRHNEDAISSFLEKYVFEERSLARRNKDENDCLVAVANSEQVALLFESLEGVFDLGFKQSEVLKEVRAANRIALVQMNLGEKRRRAFCDQGDTNRIKALQQGRSAGNAAVSAYLGDTSAIVPECDLTLQLHKIIPKHHEKEESDKTQTMFALYSPHRSTAGFVRS